MKFSKSDGFTLIEVLLFMAITGLLVASVLATTGGTINAQRYKDSSSSLKSMIQMQYSNAINVDNQRTADLSCGTISTGAGQSSCVIWGRIIKFDSSTKSKVTSRYIISSDIADDSDMSLDSYSSDFAIFDKYRVREPGADYMVADSYDMEWGTSISEIRRPSDPNIYDKFTILIIRSPLTGVLRTYMMPEAPSDTDNLTEFIKKANDNAADNKYLDLCVDPDGLVGDGIKKTAVRIYADATSASGVELIGDNNSGCGP